MFNTIAENMIGFSDTKIKKPKEARNIYTVKYFINMIRRKILMNCPLKAEEIKFGPDIHTLKGGMMIRKQIPAKTSLLKVPKKNLKTHH